MATALYVWDEVRGDVAVSAPNVSLAVALFNPDNAGSNGRKVTTANATDAFETSALGSYNPQTGLPLAP
jgi:hypothetical protein